MLKFLTLKFRNQSLNEVRPYEPQGFLRHEREVETIERSEDEDEELKSINEEVPLYNNNNNLESEEPNSKPSNYQPTALTRNDSSTLDQENQPPISQIEGNRIPQSDFTPIDIPNTMMEGITATSFSAEKRKWSQVNSKVFLHQLTSGADSSSDDEIKELCSNKPSPLLLSSSPPGKVTVLSKHSALCARIRPTDGVGHSRKKHRVIICEERPWLNFEKMQQKTLSKKHMHSLSRPRVVRIRSNSHSSFKPGLNYDSTVRSFRPIQLNATFNLAPVEEPGCAF